jgi:hypothetical protein
MIRKALADRGVRTVESGVDPHIIPVEDRQFGDEGIDDGRFDGNRLQDEKEPLDPPTQAAENHHPRVTLSAAEPEDLPKGRIG